MSTATEVIAHHWAFAVFLVVAIGLCSLMLLGAFFLGGRAQARAKHTPFESGIDAVGTARIGALDWTPARSKRQSKPGTITNSNSHPQ